MSRSGVLATSLRLRACPNATPGPSRIPAVVYSRSNSSRSLRPRHSHNAWRREERRWNSAQVKPNVAVPPHEEAAFRTLAANLSASQPCFGARGDEITIITEPDQFKRTLLEMLKRAKQRIVISSLYIGASQFELVDAIRTSMKANPHLRATFILDYHRSTRLAPQAGQPPSTAHALLPLVEEFGDRAEVWLFRSPKLRGIMEKVVPARFDEGWGTWHGKWYGVDDEVLLSGANLSTTYFTNRQDRYIHFNNHPSLLSYLSSLTRLFTHYSYRLTPSDTTTMSRNYLVPLPSPPGEQPSKASLVWPVPSIHPRGFSQHALATLSAFQNSWKASNTARSRRIDVDTWFWPVIQAGVLGMKEEEAAMADVWNAVNAAYAGDGAKVEVDLTSGYFGLYKAYKKHVIDSPAPVKIICASPKANGFYGSKGFSRLIPEGYTLLESRFYRDAASRGRIWNAGTSSGMRLKEWDREGWTYHSKGLWLSPCGTSPAGTNLSQSNPFLTFIGSSNLSTRSLTLDTELSLLMMTGSPSLRKALGSEVRGLDRHAVVVGAETFKSEERKVSWLAWALVALGVEGML